MGAAAARDALTNASAAAAETALVLVEEEEGEAMTPAEAALSRVPQK